MITITLCGSPTEKAEITLQIMHSLPAWFSPPEDIDRKALLHRDMPFFAAYDGVQAVGFLTLKVHNEYTAEIYNFGVLEAWHRQGIGGQLLHAAKEYWRASQGQYITVKTLDASAVYEPYERTRGFYRKHGFVPLEVFPTYWNEANPCLFLVAAL